MNIRARLLYLSFINGYEPDPAKNVDCKKTWEKKWNEEYKILQLTDELKSNIYHVYIDCHKDGLK